MVYWQYEGEIGFIIYHLNFKMNCSTSEKIRLIRVRYGEGGLLKCQRQKEELHYQVNLVF